MPCSCCNCIVGVCIATVRREGSPEVPREWRMESDLPRGYSKDIEQASKQAVKRSSSLQVVIRLCGKVHNSIYYIHTYVHSTYKDTSSISLLCFVIDRSFVGISRENLRQGGDRRGTTVCGPDSSAGIHGGDKGGSP